jgi:hypothetical protein
VDDEYPGTCQKEKKKERKSLSIDVERPMKEKIFYKFYK